MRFYSRTTRRLIIPTLILSVAAIGFVPQRSACRFMPGSGSLTRACGQSAMCCQLASTSTSTCCCPCCLASRQCCCGLACQCTSAPKVPISVPPRSTSPDQETELVAEPCIDVTVGVAIHSGWHSLVSPSSYLLEAPTLQQQHVRIQT